MSLTASIIITPSSHSPARVVALGSALRRGLLMLALAFGAAAVGRGQALPVLVGTFNLDNEFETAPPEPTGSAGFYDATSGEGSKLSLAVPFTTGGQDAGLLALVVGFTDPSGIALDLSLYSDLGGAPGLALGSFMPFLEIFPGYFAFIAPEFMQLAIAPSTTYWLVFTATEDGSSFGLATTDAGASYGLPGWTVGSNYSYSINEGAWVANTSGEQVMFSSIGLVGVPEPSTYAAIAGGAMLGFAAWRRRHAGRAAAQAAA